MEALAHFTILFAFIASAVFFGTTNLDSFMDAMVSEQRHEFRIIRAIESSHINYIYSAWFFHIIVHDPPHDPCSII